MKTFLNDCNGSEGMLGPHYQTVTCVWFAEIPCTRVHYLGFAVSLSCFIFLGRCFGSQQLLTSLR